MANSRPTLRSVDTPPSMQEVAFQSLKQAIMRKELLPGTIYSEQTVAKEMGMSKTPVHQALLDLENKGLSTVPACVFALTDLTMLALESAYLSLYSLEPCHPSFANQHRV